MQEFLITILKENGLVAMLLVGSLWFFMDRMKRMEARQEKTEDFIRDKMGGTIDANTAALVSLERAVEGIPCRMEHVK